MSGKCNGWKSMRTERKRAPTDLIGGLSVHGERREWDHRNRAGDVTADWREDTSGIRTSNSYLR